MHKNNVFDELLKREFIQQLTHPEEIKHLLGNEKVTCYVGIDPTASSLHVGHLLPLMMMMHLQRAGHRPLIIVGGGTGMIGDPSCKTEMRNMLTVDDINENMKGLMSQISKLLDFSDGKALMLNNADWLLSVNYIDFLRDIGSHFSVNKMLTADAYRTRMERPESGLNFVELNYMLLQSYDFLELKRTYGCSLQIGGDDQWSNIISGIDLIRKKDQDKAYGLTIPLLITSTGQKMGKTESGAIWLSPDKTSPFKFYQYWRNTHDDDVKRFLALYTMLPMEEIELLCIGSGDELNKAKKILAFEVTKLIHGESAAQEAADTALARFNGVGVDNRMPMTMILADELECGLSVIDAFVKANLCNTKSDARRLIQQNGLSVNGVKLKNPTQLLTLSDVIEDKLILKRGKEDYHALKIVC